jgi:hypothetical protein
MKKYGNAIRQIIFAIKKRKQKKLKKIFLLTQPLYPCFNLLDVYNIKLFVKERKS